MSDTEAILEFAETLVYRATSTYFSELQRYILVATLQKNRKTYDQIAAESGYSAKYVKQDVAPKLWLLLTEVLGQKVSKANVRNILEHYIAEHSLPKHSASAPFASAPPPESRQIRTPPISKPASPSSQALSQNTSLLPAAEPLAATTILLVDDQPKNLRLLSDLLEEQGYEVQQAINGTVALQAVSANKPDLILLDIYMPDIDGYSVCQQIKADPASRDIPVIFVSALDEAWDKVRAFSAGGSDYITKPFKVVEVLARVENQLKIQQLQRALMAQNAQLRQANQELRRLAAIDELTQVANRRRVDDYLQACWQQAAETQTALSVMFCRVENFGFYGEGGDALKGNHYLCQIAALIGQVVHGPANLVGRYSTLTFVVVLPEQDQTGIEQISGELLKQMATMKNDLQLAIALKIETKTALPALETQDFQSFYNLYELIALG